MNKNIKKNVAFAKGTPSVFVVLTPFQLLCAAEAIKEFQIFDYEFVLSFNRNEKRNDQVLSMMQDFGFTYSIKYLDEIDTNSRKSWINNGKRYDRVFLGDVFSIEVKIIALCYAKAGASLVYLDDGNSMIQSLKGKSFELFPKRLIDIYGLNWSYWKNRTIVYYKYRRLCRKMNVFNGINVFTIFDGIKNRHISLYSNRLSFLQERTSCELQDLVLFIGNPIRVYSNQIGMEEREIEKMIENKLMDIRVKNPDSSIIYIPHGRDFNSRISKICNEIGVEFTPISVAIELFVIKNGICPRLVYGINSTALLTLKILLPGIKVINLRVDKKDAPFNNFFKEVSRYYISQGIDEELVCE